MISFDCRRAHSLLTASVGGHATEAERLLLENHLEACERCRADRGAFEGLRRLSGWEPPRLSDDARERVRRSTLSVAQSPQAFASPRWWAWWLVAAGVGTAVAVSVWPRHLPSSRLLDGDVVAQPAANGAIVDGAALSSSRGGRAVLAGPVVSLAPSSRAVWHEPARTLALELGAVEVDVDPAQGRGFRVETTRFRVEVVGTRFSVDLQGVRTQRGKVRVVDVASGAELALVAAGEAWSWTDAPAVKTSAPDRVPAAPPPAGMPAVGGKHVPARTEAKATGDEGGESLALARQVLAKGDGAGARALLALALASPSRAVAAEAKTLRAESFLVEADYGQALVEYEAVARDFEGTPQAESALYAMAQLLVEHGGPDEAVRGLTRYLEFYPRGRFALEVRARLNALSGTRPP